MAWVLILHSNHGSWYCHQAVTHQRSSTCWCLVGDNWTASNCVYHLRMLTDVAEDHMWLMISWSHILAYRLRTDVGRNHAAQYMQWDQQCVWWTRSNQGLSPAEPHRQAGQRTTCACHDGCTVNDHGGVTACHQAGNVVPVHAMTDVLWTTMEVWLHVIRQVMSYLCMPRRMYCEQPWRCDCMSSGKWCRTKWQWCSALWKEAAGSVRGLVYLV